MHLIIRFQLKNHGGGTVKYEELLYKKKLNDWTFQFHMSHHPCLLVLVQGLPEKKEYYLVEANPLQKVEKGLKYWKLFFHP